MKKKYTTNAKFFVVFALNERVETYQDFKLKTIKNETLGLFSAISNTPNNELTDGEIAEALLQSLINLYSDSTCSHCIPALINWYLVSE